MPPFRSSRWRNRYAAWKTPLNYRSADLVARCRTGYYAPKW
jgi:hypothetical protein